MKRRFWRQMFVLLLVFCSIGFAFSEGQSDKTGQPVTITWWEGSWWAQYTPDIVKAFEKENPGISVNAETLPITGYYDKAVAAMLSSKAPDVLAVQIPLMMPGFASKGLLEQLDKYVEKSTVCKQANFFPSAWNVGLFQEKRFVVCYRTDPWGLFYNKDMFRKAGLDPSKPPLTRLEMLEAAKKMTGDGKYGMWLYGSAKSDQSIADSSQTIWAFGGQVLDASGKKALLDSDASVKAMTWWAELLTKHKVVPSSAIELDANETGRLFGAGTVATFIAGTWGVGTFKDTALPDLDYAISPTPLDGVGWHGPWGMGIPKKSDKKAAAWKFVEWFTRMDVLPKVMVPGVMGLPTTTSALDDPRWGQDPKLGPFVHNAVKPGLGTLPLVSGNTEIMEIMHVQLQALLAQKSSAKEAMAKATEQINQLFK